MSNDHPDYENHPLRFFMPFSENERFLNRFQELEAEIQSLKNQLANRDAQLAGIFPNGQDFDDLRRERDELKTLLARYLRNS